MNDITNDDTKHGYSTALVFKEERFSISYGRGSSSRLFSGSINLSSSSSIYFNIWDTKEPFDVVFDIMKRIKYKDNNPEDVELLYNTLVRFVFSKLDLKQFINIIQTTYNRAFEDGKRSKQYELLNVLGL